MLAHLLHWLRSGIRRLGSTSNRVIMLVIVSLLIGAVLGAYLQAAGVADITVLLPA